MGCEQESVDGKLPGDVRLMRLLIRYLPIEAWRRRPCNRTEVHSAAHAPSGATARRKTGAPMASPSRAELGKDQRIECYTFFQKLLDIDSESQYW
jgi:hypothetical protein